MAQNYLSNGNLRASRPSENNGLACNNPATMRTDQAENEEEVVLKSKIVS
jgi:hypothetical protein